MFALQKSQDNSLPLKSIQSIIFNNELNPHMSLDIKVLIDSKNESLNLSNYIQQQGSISGLKQ
jgi:hypothetical protein